MVNYVKQGLFVFILIVGIAFALPCRADEQLDQMMEQMNSKKTRSNAVNDATRKIRKGGRYARQAVNSAFSSLWSSINNLNVQTAPAQDVEEGEDANLNSSPPSYYTSSSSPSPYMHDPLSPINRAGVGIILDTTGATNEIGEGINEVVDGN